MGLVAHLCDLSPQMLMEKDFFFVCLFETGLLCSPGCPGTCYVDQTSVEIANTYIPLPAGIKGVQPCLALGCRF